MGQKVVSRKKQQRIDNDRSEGRCLPQLSIFPTDLGWFGLWGSGSRIRGLTIGHTSLTDVREFVWQKCDSPVESQPDEETDWIPELRQRLEQYTRGFEKDFGDYEVDFPVQTAFQQRVLAETRRIGYGCTLTYNQLAEKAGFPRAARAVGSVMASNRVPIIIPCHRVVAAGGKWGGFSAPQGISLKQSMLQKEAETAGICERGIHAAASGICTPR